MGSIYMREVMGVENPRVGLVNNGAEEEKGNALTKEAHQLLKNSGLNFVGNIEARDLPLGACDVIVCDGFVGNVVMKLMEGCAVCFSDMLKQEFMKRPDTRLARRWQSLRCGASKGRWITRNTAERCCLA